MLPERSKRFVGADGELPRLRLASNWHLLLIAILMLGLFRIIFPHKALVERLYHQENLDELTLSYVENLHRAEKGNADLAILLGRVKRNTLSMDELQGLLLPVLMTGDARQRTIARKQLLEAFERALANTTQPHALAQLHAQARRFLEANTQDAVPAHTAAAMAALAYQLNLDALTDAFVERVAQQSSSRTMAEYASQALALGRHGLASVYYLRARRSASSRDEARYLLRQGVAALMANSQFPQAMLAADAALGDLADDPETLRYLVRTAQAAGDHARARSYAHALVFTDRSVQTKGLR